MPNIASLKSSLVRSMLAMELDVLDYLVSRLYHRKMNLESFPFYSKTENATRLADFINHLEEHQLPFDQIDHLLRGRWSSDAWTLETCRCLSNPGQYKVPLRKKYGMRKPHFNSPPIISILNWTERKLKLHAELILKADQAENLFVCETGRGIDVLLALLVKPWKTITCYDYKESHKAPLETAFKGFPLEFFTADSRELDFGSIQRPRTLLIAQDHSIPQSGIQRILENKNITVPIFTEIRNEA